MAGAATCRQLADISNGISARNLVTGSNISSIFLAAARQLCYMIFTGMVTLILKSKLHFFFFLFNCHLVLPNAQMHSLTILPRYCFFLPNFGSPVSEMIPRSPIAGWFCTPSRHTPTQKLLQLTVGLAEKLKFCSQ